MGGSDFTCERELVPKHVTYNKEKYFAFIGATMLNGKLCMHYLTL